MKHFTTSFILGIIGLIVAYLIGGVNAAYVAFLLILLEVSLSFDNAVVNARVLKDMDKVWQERFITLGIPVAVFGMRLLFPLIIVALVTNMGLIETFNTALNNPIKYEHALKSAEHTIFAFGGAFLLMVFLDFFFEEKEVSWIKRIENSKLVKKISLLSNISLSIAIIIGLILGHLTNNFDILLAYMYGVLLHAILGMIDDAFSVNSVKNGLAGFVYLEVLDASFSFDGVIGAFALSSNIFIIMIGLGVGAMFVRSITLYFVEKNTLSEYRYLEHGAHYAIGILAIIMLLKIKLDIGEAFTGTIGVGLIFIAFVHSMWENKKK
ncbi:MAG: DUF475 domain-containing protein [Sulfurovaceae bacterium]|nr:DUF475 domain-containing protein [Sulfurovaceae bacterium]MDD5548117.1 DUF475 domain-containing protein [Sulfurovaceae bacterium]